METLTVKQIATFVGKDEASVRRWIKKTSGISPDKSGIMPSLLAKLKEAEITKKPAQYDLEETLVIIETGMGKNAAEIFRTNAENHLSQTPVASTKELIKDIISEMTPVFTQMTAQMTVAIIKELKPTLQHKDQIPLQLEHKQDYFTITGYCLFHKYSFSDGEKKSFGYKAKSLSTERDVEIRKVPDEKYGYINSYHISILDELFSL